MNLSRKIEEICKKPEHIRRRYAFACTGVAMVFVMLVWFLSFSSQKIETPDFNAVGQSQMWQQFNDQKKSLEDVTAKTKNSVQQGLIDAQKAQNNQQNAGIPPVPTDDNAASGAEMPSNTP